MSHNAYVSEKKGLNYKRHPDNSLQMKTATQNTTGSIYITKSCPAFAIHLYIHFLKLIWGQAVVAAGSGVSPDVPLSSNIFYVLVGNPQALLPVGLVNIPGSILIMCLNHLSWLFFKWRSSNSTPELFTLSVSPAILQRKLISALLSHSFRFGT